MARKYNTGPKKRKDPLPDEFASIDEAIEFWDTHSTADYEEFMTEVNFEVNLKQRTHLIGIEGPVYERIRAIAKKKRVHADELVNRWIREKIRTAA